MRLLNLSEGMKTKRPTRTQLIKKADKLFSELVRKRGICQKCGGKENLQCAHVVSRVNKNLRWNEDNALCLDLKCHLYWMHRNPMEFSEWFKKEFPIQWGFLRREIHKVNPDLGTTIEFTIKELTERLKSYEQT